VRRTTIGWRKNTSKYPRDFQNLPRILTVSHLPEKLQHRNHGDDHARQRRADCNDADRLFLEGVEPGAESRELRLHPIAPVFAAHHDLQGEEAAVECGEPVPYGFPAKVTLLG